MRNATRLAKGTGGILLAALRGQQMIGQRAPDKERYFVICEIRAFRQQQSARSVKAESIGKLRLEIGNKTGLAMHEQRFALRLLGHA